MSSANIEAQVEAWTPAVPFKLKNNIVSSDYAHAKPFIPSYEKESRPCIEQLITNEYQRIWWQELRSSQNKTVSKTIRQKILPRTVLKAKMSNVKSSFDKKNPKGRDAFKKESKITP